MTKHYLAISVLIFIFVAGCSSDSKKTTMSATTKHLDSNNISDQAGLVEYLDGSEYLSVKEGGVGNGPDGVVMGRLSIVFTNKVFDWSNSGLVFQGSYEILYTNLMKATLGNATYEVPIDPIENTIVWMGEIYQRSQ